MSFKQELFENVITARNLQKLHEEKKFQSSIDFVRAATEELYKQVDVKSQIIQASKVGNFSTVLTYDLDVLIKKTISYKW